jgi:hypothetical protein
MGAFFTAILAKFTAFAAWIAALAKSVFDAGWDMLKDGASWLFESVIDVCIAAINSLDLSGLDAYTSSWSGLPPEVLQVLGVLRVGEASAIIVAAILIRLALQLIPFVRLGS